MSYKPYNLKLPQANTRGIFNFVSSELKSAEAKKLFIPQSNYWKISRRRIN